MEFTGERAVPWNDKTGIIMDFHTQRYAWAMQFCHGLTVADLGCGTGYGSFMLSWVANDVIGMDTSVLAIAFAKSNFAAANLTYYTGDITADVPRADVYVALEVLEHLDDPQALAGSLSCKLVWSIPILTPGGYHKHTYDKHKAERDFGGEIWYQSKAGYIVPKAAAQFQPHYILGVVE